MGLTWVARRAGTQQANRAIPMRTTATMAICGEVRAGEPGHQGRKQVRQSVGAREADHQPEACEQQPAGQHQPEHAARPCAERDPDAEFPRALGDDIGDHAVEADRRKHEPEQGEARESLVMTTRLWLNRSSASGTVYISWTATSGSMSETAWRTWFLNIAGAAPRTRRGTYSPTAR